MNTQDLLAKLKELKPAIMARYKAKDIGLDKGILRLAPYCDDWPRLYEDEAKRIREAIGPFIRDVQHFGSTSIPGMIAKPIIDIAVAVDSLDAAEACLEPLKGIGFEYRWRSNDPNSYYLTKGNPEEYHLRIFEMNSSAWKDHLRFRDRLRDDPNLARDYASLKSRLCRKHQADREAYQSAKSDFVKKVLGQTQAGPEASAEERR